VPLLSLRLTKVKSLVSHPYQVMELKLIHSCRSTRTAWQTQAKQPSSSCSPSLDGNQTRHLQHRLPQRYQSVTSWGPDFATPKEGKLCDMSTKTLYTLCSKEDVDGCVEISTNPTNGTAQQPSVAMRKVSVAKRTVSSPIRSYEETSVWSGDDWSPKPYCRVLRSTWTGRWIWMDG
jgi:hypothetical protein